MAKTRDIQFDLDRNQLGFRYKNSFQSSINRFKNALKNKKIMEFWTSLFFSDYIISVIISFAVNLFLFKEKLTSF